MAKPRRNSSPPDRGGLLRTRIRFSPQVLVFGLTAVLAFFPLREAVGSAIYWFYGDSYRQVDFVVSEVVPNDGWPYARGLLEPDGEEWVLEIADRGGRPVVLAAPEVSAAPGARVRVWWSDRAPVVGFGAGKSTKIVPVAARPRLPGAGRSLFWIGCSLAALWIGLVATAWTAKRFAREWRTDTPA